MFLRKDYEKERGRQGHKRGEERKKQALNLQQKNQKDLLKILMIFQDSGFSVSLTLPRFWSLKEIKTQ